MGLFAGTAAPPFPSGGSLGPFSWFHVDSLEQDRRRYTSKAHEMMDVGAILSGVL